jgi:hypothetical protein
MNYPLIVAISVIVVAILLLYLFRRNKDDNSYKNYIKRVITTKDIDRDLLIKLAKYEKFIYLQGFTRRVLIEYRYKKSIIYRAYYYNLLNGVHLYLEANVLNSEDNFNSIFATRFKDDEFITYNKSIIDPLETLTKDDSREQYEDATIEELYNIHLKNREDFNNEIIYNRLTQKELLHDRYNTNRAKSNVTKEIKRGNSRGTFKIVVKSVLVILTLLATGYLYYKVYSPISNSKDLNNTNSITKIKKPKVEKKEKIEKIEKIEDIDKEFKDFNKKVLSYKALSLTLSSQNSHSLNSSLAILDNYLKESKINRKVDKPAAVEIGKGILPCAMPKELVELYNWHDGIKKFIPARDFYSVEELVKNYIKYNDDKKEPYVIVFGESDGSKGLAYSCDKQGLYEYDAVSKVSAKKDFYNIAHFLKVVANSYKAGAFYDDKVFINIDMKSFLNIYRKFLTKVDKNRYEYLVSYLKRKAKQYKKYGNKKLKMALLEEIENLYDSRLTESAGLFLKSSDTQIKAKAIEVIGRIGDKDSLKILKPLLNSKNSRVKDFALLAMSNIVDKNNTNLLKDIYPLLKDRSIFVRLSAYRVIENIANVSSLEILRENFEKESSRVKVGIIRALAKIGNKNDITLLNNYLNKLPDTIDSVDPKEYIRGSKPGNLILTIETQNAIDDINGRIKEDFRVSLKN